MQIRLLFIVFVVNMKPAEIDLRRAFISVEIKGNLTKVIVLSKSVLENCGIRNAFSQFALSIVSKDFTPNHHLLCKLVLKVAQHDLLL